MILFFNTITDNLTQFSGSGLMFTLWLTCILFLIFYMKKGTKKTILCWYGLYGLAVYFCPVWYFYIVNRDDSEILYRIFWLIPMGIIAVYAAIEIIYKLERKVRVIGVIATILIIIFSGQFIYSNKYYSKADNMYHIPDTVIHICDEIIIPGREVKACFPDEMLQYVRQYTALVFMPYGRSIFMMNGNNGNADLWNYLHQSSVDTKILVDMLRESHTHYIILENEDMLTESLETYGFLLKSVIDDYEIYLDSSVDLTVP